MPNMRWDRKGNFILEAGEKMAGDKGIDILFQDDSRKFTVVSSAWISPTLLPEGSFCFSDCVFVFLLPIFHFIRSLENNCTTRKNYG